MNRPATHDSLDAFFADARLAVASFDDWVGRYAPPARADHLCYKCADAQEFERIRSLFEHGSQFVYQSMIAGRRIAIVKFLVSIPSALGDIWFLELSDQKPDGSQASGFDHVEIYPVSGPVSDLADALAASGFPLERVVRPHHTTYDASLLGRFKVRLEPEPLLEKIIRDEMGVMVTASVPPFSP